MQLHKPIKIECKAKGCKKTKGVKIYATFCGIKIAYCKEHNYLFRDIELINKMAQGSIKHQQDYLKRRTELKEHKRAKEWKNAPLI